KAESGSQKEIQIIHDYQLHLTHFLSILNNLFNPHYFVFGGGLADQKLLFQNVEKNLSEKTFLPKAFAPKIYVNQLGDSAGLFGAMIYSNLPIS
ncbi:MAG: ROK family protein, partial [Bdellovibrionales bacterium]|nr:ROK family protein [Bdellovibrionales bacterium]